MISVTRKKREKPREKSTKTPFRPAGNSNGVTETRTHVSIVFCKLHILFIFVGFTFTSRWLLM